MKEIEETRRKEESEDTMIAVKIPAENPADIITEVTPRDSDDRIIRRERNEQLSRCIVKKEVPEDMAEKERI